MRSKLLRTAVVTVFLGLSAVLLIPEPTDAWDYNSPVWAYQCYSSPRGGRICTHLNTNLKYGQGWNLYSFDYVNGVHWAWADVGTSCGNISGMTMSGAWNFSGVGASATAGTGGVGITLSISGSTVNFTASAITWCNYIEHYFGGPHPTGMLFFRSENVYGSALLYGTNVSVNSYGSDYM